MDKRISSKQMDKIAKYNSYESKNIKLKCGEECIEIKVTPVIDYAKRFGIIETSVGIMFADNDKCNASLFSSAYNHALLCCYTNLKSDNASKIINLSLSTDIVSMVKDVLPESVVRDFDTDFNKTVENHVRIISPTNKILDFLSVLKVVLDEAGNITEEEYSKMIKESSVED